MTMIVKGAPANEDHRFAFPRSVWPTGVHRRILGRTVGPARLVPPVDVYPDQRSRGPERLERLNEHEYLVTSLFLEVQTDGTLTGLAGPIGADQAYMIDHVLSHVIIGEDPLAIERLWDRMYRLAIHGRKGVVMQAISAIDCALWDLKGKWAVAPVYQLLGGPLRSEIPAYASALGYSIEPAAAAARARELIAQGYQATKWFFRYGPGSGRDGMQANIALAGALRDAIGPDRDLMLDAWNSWDVPYAVAIGEALAAVHPRWLEEPVPPDRLGSYVELRQRLLFPIAGGEHEYTRWGLKQLMDAGAADVLQPDIYWAGGVSEMLKICTLASTYDVQIIPHGHSTPATAHVLFAPPPQLC
ncbi:MAG: mandelate racemase/muconate lactonizing protein, partial [Chloroflexi bacterium]|nr:mandelate racemase/muconate lactonizing protein [Chloroflexota bacterium]